MNSLCTINSQLINLPNSELKPPSNFTANYTLNIPLDNDPDLVLHYPFNHNIYNYGTSTSLSTNRGPNIGVQDATIVGATDISFLSTTTSIYNSGTSAYNDYSGNILIPLTVDPKLVCLYTFEPMDVSGSDPNRRVLNQANGVYDLLLDTGVIIDGTENIPNVAGIDSVRNTAASGNLRTSFNSATSFSIGSWVYYTTNTNTQSVAGVFLGYVPTSGNSQIWIYKLAGSNFLTFRIQANDLSGGSTYYSEAYIPVNINSWNFFTWVATSTSWTIYMNGTTYTSGVNMNFGYVRTSTPVFAINSTFQNNFIGSVAGSSNFKDGKIDNFFIYSGALSSSQVADIRSKGQTPSPTNYYYTIPIQYYQYPKPYLSINSIPTNTAGYTISFFVKWINSNIPFVVFSFANSLSTNNNISLAIEQSIDAIFYFYLNNSSYLFTKNTLSFSDWNHIACTISLLNETKFYFDGILIETTTTIPYSSFAFNYNRIMANTYSAYSDANGAGYLNDFRYYNRVLDSAEIKQLSNIYDLSNNKVTTPFKLNADPSLCLYYTFDVSNNSVTNYAPKYYGTNEASYVNGAYSNYSDISYTGTGGLKLKDTANGFVILNSNSVVNTPGFISSSNGMTFMCWFYSTNSTNQAKLFDFNDVYNSYSENIFVCISNNSISSSVYTSSSTNSTLSLTTNYNNSIRRHVTWTMTYSATQASTWALYIDASMISTTSNNYYPDQIARPSSFIGKSNISSDPSFNGYIDDFRVYQRVLPQSDISQIYLYKNTLVNNSINLSWTPPVQYQNSSYNVYYTDNYFNTNSNTSSQTSITNYTYQNLLTGDGLTYYLNSQIGQRNSSYLNSNIISNSLSIDPSLAFFYTFNPSDMSGQYMKNQATNTYDLLVDVGVIIDGTENIPNVNDTSGSQIAPDVGVTYKDSFTIGGWFYFSTAISTTSNNYIYTSRGGSTGQINIFSDITYIYFNFRSDDNSNGFVLFPISKLNLTVNNWYFLACVVNSDPISGWTTYVNGYVKISRNSYYPFKTIPNTKSNSYIGTTKVSAGQNYKGGKLDGMFMINKALTVPQIIDIHMKGQDPSSNNYFYTIPIQYYQYTNPSYYVQDYLGPNPLVVDPSLVLFYIFNPSYVFNNNVLNQATGLYDLNLNNTSAGDVTINSTQNSLDISTNISTTHVINTLPKINFNSSFTIGVWVYSSISNGSQQYVCSFYNTSITNNSISILKGASNNFLFRAYNNVTLLTVEPGFPSTSSINTWYFLTVVVTNKRTIRTYVNGNMTDSVFYNNGSINTDVDYKYNVISGIYNINQDNNSTNFFGSISNVFLYNDVLSANQILDIYQKTNPPTSPPTPTNYYNTVPIQYYTYNYT